MATLQKIQELYQNYMGIPVDSATAGKLSMKSDMEVEDILKNTKTDVQSEAADKAKSAIASLSSNLPAGPENDYLSTMAKGKSELEKMYGIDEAEKRTKEAEDFYKQVSQKGPMFETVMRGGLQQASPTFLGATRKSLEQYFQNIPNPFVRDNMINNYLDASDRSMTATLSALNGLYQTALMSAKDELNTQNTAYQRVADKVKDLYSELQFINRERYNEEQDLRTYEKKKAVDDKYKSKLGEYTGKYEKDYLMERANDFVNDDGTIDWLELDKIQNTSNDLYNDLVTFITTELRKQADTEGQTETTASSQLKVDAQGNIASPFGQSQGFSSLSIPQATPNSYGKIDEKGNFIPLEEDEELGVPKELRWLFK